MNDDAPEGEGIFMGLVGPRVMNERREPMEGLVTTPCARCGLDVWGRAEIIAKYPDAITCCEECANVAPHLCVHGGS